MKINLLKTKDNHLKGWDIIPENVEEKKILGSIRNAIFFGFDDTHPKYDGIETVGNYVTKLKWRIPKYNNENII